MGQNSSAVPPGLSFSLKVQSFWQSGQYTPVFSVFPLDCLWCKELNWTQKGPYAPKEVLSERKSSPHSFLACEQLPQGTVYPLAVKHTRCCI